MLDLFLAGIPVLTFAGLGVAGILAYNSLSESTKRYRALERLSIAEKLALVEKNEAYIMCKDGSHYARKSEAGSQGDLDIKLAAGFCTVRIGPWSPPPKRPACYPFCRMEDMSSLRLDQPTAG
jgi:hypothetical protein